MTIATDNFNRANSTDLGVNWDRNTQLIQVNINLCEVFNGTLDAVETWNANTFDPDQFSQITLIDFNGIGANNLSGVGVGVRWSSGTTQTGYWFVANEHLTLGASIVKRIGGVSTTLAQANVNWSEGDVIRLEAEGNLLRGKRNGSVVLEVAADPAIVGIRPAICMAKGFVKRAQLDNWSGGDLVEGPPGGIFLMAQGML